MPFDLITLDVLLPDNDGFSVLEALKSSPDTCDIPVMMLSMLPDEGEGRRLGAVDYLVKPVAEGVLVDHIRTLLATAPIAAAGTILIADDDADIRKLIASNLMRAGYEVLTASNGEEALAILQEQHIDLILLDVRMPVMDGITALRRLRANDATKSQAVVMMTASPGAVSDITPVLTHLGVQDLLLKPLTAAELAATIEKTLTTLRGAQA
jgi:DNA-binding response OmpR family regulator